MLRRFGLQQAQLAEVLGVNLDRVKSLVLGRAQALRHGELTALERTYGLARDWLVDGRPPAEVPRRSELPPGVDGAHRTGEARAPPYGQALAVGDAALLQRVIEATSKALDSRGLQLAPEQRLRLYWAVFELSLAGGVVNDAAIGPLITVAAGAAGR